MPITRPNNYAVPFAFSGLKNTIPTAPTGTGKASFTTGFPPVTMQPLSSGGIPPEGKDFNGILYDITTHTIWINAGGQYQFDATLSTAIGGYPIGMVLQTNDGASAYVSAVNNNTIDFNSNPASIGNQWLAWGGSAVVKATLPLYIISPRTVTPGVYLVNTGAGSFSLTLPAAPAVGDSIELIDVFGTWLSFPLTILRNGNTIMNVADDLICNIRGLEFRLIYNGTTWRLQ